VTGATPVIEMQAVSFSYDGSPAVDDVSLEIRAGDFACLIGPNAGGKTTLLKLMLGLLEPQRGRVRIFGRSPAESRHRIGYMAQQPRFDPRFPARVLDVVLMGRLGPGANAGFWRRRDRDVANSALEAVALADCARRPFSTLSGGQQRRVLIARALACEPDLLLLDEPTANLDIEVEERIYGLLRELSERLTIIVVSHDVGFVSKYVKTAVCVNRTAHVHTRDELSGEVIRELYGREVRTVHPIAADEHAHGARSPRAAK
jgi:zinc transport system ATP-binding protein